MMNTYQILSDLVKVKPIEKIVVKLGLMVVLVYIFSYIINNYYYDTIHWYRYDNQNTRISLVDSVFHTMSCWFTVGFGEIIPKSSSVKILSVVIMMCAYIITLL